MKIILHSKSFLIKTVSIAILFFISTSVFAGFNDTLIEETSKDSLKKSETHQEKKVGRKQKRKEDMQEMKDTHSRFILSANSVFASLDTRVTFKGHKNIINLSLGLEENLGLPSKRYFIAGSFMYRITPRSGLYIEYYGINRKEKHTAKDDFIWERDTLIHVGASFSAYFNTQVASAGYLLSALKAPDAFLGFYFNLYVMYVKTGIDTDIGDFNGAIGLTVPLPNIGIIGMFKLTKWLNFNTTLGVFSLNTKNFGGTIYSLNISFLFKPVRWMGISLSYRDFNVTFYNSLTKDINYNINYNFKGPALGLMFVF
jgi:hypothetical protein